MNKDRYQSTSARRALALLNSPLVFELSMIVHCAFELRHLVSKFYSVVVFLVVHLSLVQRKLVSLILVQRKLVSLSLVQRKLCSLSLVQRKLVSLSLVQRKLVSFIYQLFWYFQSCYPKHNSVSYHIICVIETAVFGQQFKFCNELINCL